MKQPDEVTPDRWIDDQAGPVVRPYAMTGGRTRPRQGRFDLISLVVTIRQVPPVYAELGPEHLAILHHCQVPLSVAEVAAYLDLPLGTVRVMLGDLLEHAMVQVQDPPTTPHGPDDGMFQTLINGLRAL
jgi:hypothetical protein